MNYASIVPLIGGETIAMQNALKWIKLPGTSTAYQVWCNFENSCCKYPAILSEKMGYWTTFSGVDTVETAKSPFKTVSNGILGSQKSSCYRV